jgi:hypothetical protein
MLAGTPEVGVVPVAGEAPGSSDDSSPMLGVEVPAAPGSVPLEPHAASAITMVARRRGRLRRRMS